MACKKGQFDVVELMVNDLKTCSINLNAQLVNGMTPFALAFSKISKNAWTVIRYSRYASRVELVGYCRPLYGGGGHRVL